MDLNKTNQNATNLGDLLWENPEPGFYEWETHKIVKEAFEEMGFILEEFQDFPGFSATLDGHTKTKKIHLISDMDALPNPEAKDGSYIHSCGHHQQLVALVETARVLLKTNKTALEHIAFVAIPGEEFIDFPKRQKLKEEGKITHLSGKLELIHRGFFDTPDYIISTHSAGGMTNRFINSVRLMSGFKVMSFEFTGRNAHAGAQPHLGINAQNAASLFLQSCGFLRESFYEGDHIRIHPILKLAEDQSVNLIPAYARVETYVRAATVEAVDETVNKLEKAAKGSAMAIGAEVEIRVEEGYAPFKVDMKLHEIARKTCQDLDVEFIDEEFSAASSDVGNLSQMKPAVMLGLPGCNGLFHNPGFRITDTEAGFQFPGVFIARYLKNFIDTLP